MDEKDYVKIAHDLAEEKIMDEYWLNIARTSTWISKDGTKTAFKDLELAHLQHIINGLLEFENEYCKLVVKKLITELTVRVKRKPPRYAYDAVEQLTVLAVDNGADKNQVYALRSTILDEFDRLKNS